MESSNKYEEIAKISFNIFNSLPKTGKPKINEWTVLSCIVQEKYSNFEAVALGTGSKCIGRNKMSNKGDILNDSHAEVICRRAFLLYLYEQMKFSFENKNSVFLYDVDLLKFSLKTDIKFHFFTTLMPCGDGSIFPKNEKNCFNVGDLITKVKSRASKKRALDIEHPDYKKLKNNDGDIFRTGAKCLDCDENQDRQEEGMGFHVTGVVRTKPGRGDPTLSVSCSDKMTKWCHLGLQGALLSILLKEPIYLSSFIITSDTPFSEESLQRAFYDRMHDVKMIIPYKKSQLTFYQTNCSIFPFQKDDEKEVCPSSISWFRSEQLKRNFEVTVGGKKQGVTKKNRELASSRVKFCKIELFKRFLTLYGNLNENFSKLTYYQCKEKAILYQQNWEILKKEFRVWPKQESSLSEFCMDTNSV